MHGMTKRSCRIYAPAANDGKLELQTLLFLGVSTAWGQIGPSLGPQCLLLHPAPMQQHEPVSYFWKTYIVDTLVVNCNAVAQGYTL